MLKRLLAVVPGLLLCAGAVAPIAAQDVGVSRPVTFGAAAGLAVPMGDFGDGVGTGFNVTGLIGFGMAELPVGGRFEVGYNRFEFNDDVGFDGNISMLSGILNAVFSIPTEGGISPYLIGGVGAYRSSFSVEGLGDSDESETDFGLNGGAGVRFGLAGFRTFLEARYHSIFAEGESVNFIPIVFGIEF